MKHGAEWRGAVDAKRRVRALNGVELSVIPALTLRQPWAWAVFHAGKVIENRGKNTSIRGRFVIHAGQNADRSYYEQAIRWMVSHGLAVSEEYPDLIPSRGSPPNGLPVVPALAKLERGQLLGTVALVDVLPRAASEDFGSWRMLGQYGYVLRDARRCKPVDYDGYPGWFYVNTNEVVDA